MANAILEIRLRRVSLLSSHSPPLDAFIISLTADSGIFLLLRAFLLAEIGPSTVIRVLNAPRSSLMAFRFLLFPPMVILSYVLGEVGPATRGVVLKVCRRFLYIRRGACGRLSASAKALIKSSGSGSDPMVGMSLILSMLMIFHAG